MGMQQQQGGMGGGGFGYNTSPGMLSNPNIPQGDMSQGGSLANQYGWGGGSPYGWGGPYGSQSWGGWNQMSTNPGALNGLVGGASSGYPWMQNLGPFLQYLQGGMNPQGAAGGGATSSPAPGAPPTLSSPHFQNMGRMTGAPVAAGDQSPQYSARSQMQQAFNQFIRPTPIYQHNAQVISAGQVPGAGQEWAY